MDIPVRRTAAHEPHLLSKRYEYCISEKNSGDEAGEFLGAGGSGGDE